jgi:cytochrome P450
LIAISWDNKSRVEIILQIENADKAPKYPHETDGITGNGASRDACPAFSGAAFFADPYTTYAEIRSRNTPVLEPISKTWLMTKYADVDAILRDSRVSKIVHRESLTPFEISVLFQDPPEHRNTRGILNRAFSGNAMDGIGDRILKTADALIDKMLSRRKADFIADFALPLPLAVIAELLGIPQEDADELHRLSGVFIADETIPEEENWRRQGLSLEALKKYFEKLVETRRNDLRPDIVSSLTEDHLRGMLSHEQLIANCIFLLVAGHESTVNLLGNGLYLLLRHPEQLALLKRQPDLWPSAIEEMLRYESPVQLSTLRVTTAPVEYSCGKLDAGSPVTAVLGAANRDPEKFPEPDKFDVSRSPNRHVAFSMGPHHCTGASLARLEAQVAFSRLFERLPDLRLDSAPQQNPLSRLLSRFSSQERIPSAPEWRRNMLLRGLRHLNVSW